MDNEVAENKRRQRRTELKKLLRLSQWDELKRIYPEFNPRLTNYNGKEYFDWTSITKEMSVLFAGAAIPKISAVRKERTKPSYKFVELPLAVVSKAITHQLLESIGDRIVGLAAAIIAFEITTNRARYHNIVHALETNVNLRTAGYATGDEAEIELGVIFVMEGTSAAIASGVKLLKKTKAYTNSA